MLTSVLPSLHLPQLLCIYSCEFLYSLIKPVAHPSICRNHEHCKQTASFFLFSLHRKSSGDDNFENLDDLMDGLQFDIDGFLDLEQFSVDEVGGV